MRFFISKIHSKEGSVLTFFAVLLPVFLIMLSFVIDIGKAFILKSELNKACLIAAEEASKCIDLEKAQNFGINVLQDDFHIILKDFFQKNYAQKNNFSITSLDYRVVDSIDNPRYIIVTCQARSECFFLKVFGIEYIDVNASGIGRLRKIK